MALLALMTFVPEPSSGIGPHTSATTPNSLVENYVRTLRSAHIDNAGGSGFTASGQAYFVYMGRTTQAFVAKHVEFYVSTGGAGGQTAEVGLFSTPLAPNKAGQTLTKIVASGTLSALTGTGIMRNTTAFTETVPSGTHLWAGLRIAMVTTQPICRWLSYDFLQGVCIETVGAAALTGAGPWTGTVPNIVNGAVTVDLRVVLD
jgi:hypothetical protein